MERNNLSHAEQTVGSQPGGSATCFDISLKIQHRLGRAAGQEMKTHSTQFFKCALEVAKDDR